MLEDYLLGILSLSGDEIEECCVSLKEETRIMKGMCKNRLVRE